MWLSVSDRCKTGCDSVWNISDDTLLCEADEERMEGFFASVLWCQGIFVDVLQVGEDTCALSHEVIEKSALRAAEVVCGELCGCKAYHHASGDFALFFKADISCLVEQVESGVGLQER